jgi:hypothetical protein
MIEREIKKVVVGQLLEMLKITFNTLSYLPSAGADHQKISNLQEDIWISIMHVAGMPNEKEMGFVADDFLRIAFQYASGDKPNRDEAVNKIFNWKCI